MLLVPHPPPTKKNKNVTIDTTSFRFNLTLVITLKQIDVNARELAALRAVIGCVREFNLEASYTLDPLQKRLEQLENMKPDKKRGGGRVDGDPSKNHYHPSKKFKSKGGGWSSKFRGAQSGGPGHRKGPPGFAQRTAYKARHPGSAPPYQMPVQPLHAQQGYDQRAYYHPHGSTVSSTSYNPAGAFNYGGYNASGLQGSYPYM